MKSLSEMAPVVGAMQASANVATATDMAATVTTAVTTAVTAASRGSGAEQAHKQQRAEFECTTAGKETLKRRRSFHGTLLTLKHDSLTYNHWQIDRTASDLQLDHKFSIDFR